MRALVCAVSCLAGCGEAARQEQAGPKVTRLEPKAAAAEGRSEDEVRPVYDEVVAEVPAARALCEALYLAPLRSAAACCGREAAETNAKMLLRQCVQSLSAALASGAVALRGSEECLTALERGLAGCDWVGLWTPELPPECADILAGSLKVGASCRSSFECEAGLHCEGVGPTDRGVCAAPAPEGTLCGVGVDPLGALLRFDPELPGRPECAGACVQHRCRAALATGAACSRNAECGGEQHCDGERCVAGRRAAPGERCAGTGCASGSRCVRGTCLVPKGTGEPCEGESECRGGCLRSGTGPGRCGMRCEPLVPGAP